MNSVFVVDIPRNKMMILATYRATLLLTLLLATVLAFAPAPIVLLVRTQQHTTRMNLLGTKIKGGAKTHEEDIELTIVEIMKYAAKMDNDNCVDNADNAGTNANKPDEVVTVKSGENPLKKVRSLVNKIRGKLGKSKRNHD